MDLIRCPKCLGTSEEHLCKQAQNVPVTDPGVTGHTVLFPFPPEYVGTIT